MEGNMPSYCIHLAVGNLYAKKNKIENKKLFDEGVIAPDFAKDKEASHYSAPRDKKDILDFLHKKVQLDKYLDANEIDSDFKRGEFLHLVTDYIYFNQFFSDEEVLKYGDEFLDSMYYSYDCIKAPVEEKYGVEYPSNISEIMRAIDEKRKLLGFDKGVTKAIILPQEKLDRFIEFCANIDLQKFAEKIRKEQRVSCPNEGEFCN